MNDSPRNIDAAPVVTDLLRYLAEWLALDVPAPDQWFGKALEVRPTTDAVLARCSLVGPDGGESVPWVLPLDHGIAEAVCELQSVMATTAGTWVAAVVDVDPGGQATLRLDPTGRPAELVPGRGITPAELRAHLTAYPQPVLDPWMLDLLATPEAVRVV